MTNKKALEALFDRARSQEPHGWKTEVVRPPKALEAGPSARKTTSGNDRPK